MEPGYTHKRKRSAEHTQNLAKCSALVLKDALAIGLKTAWDLLTNQHITGDHDGC